MERASRDIDVDSWPNDDGAPKSRVRELLAALLDPDFSGFPRRRTVRVAAAAGMTQYSEELNAFLQTILPPQSLANVLGEVVAAA